MGCEVSTLQYSQASLEALDALVARLEVSLSEEFDLMNRQVEGGLSAWSVWSDSRQAQRDYSRRMRRRFDELMEALTAARRALDKVREAGEAAESRCVVLMSE